MSTLLEYRKKLRNMFLFSVKNDIKLWNISCDEYYSPEYFNIDKTCSSLFRFTEPDHQYVKKYIKINNRIGDKYRNTTGEDFFVSYKFWIFPTDLEVWRAVNKIKKHFKRIEADRADIAQISVLELALNSIEPNFKKEIRKNKLNNIDKIK